MNGSDARKARNADRRRAGWKAGVLASLISSVLGLTVGLYAAPAQAQFFRDWWWNADEGPPPIPPGDVGRRAMPRHATAPDKEYGFVPLAEIRHRASLLGLRLVAAPRRNGHVYVAFAEDTHGLLHHLAFDAHRGTLIENETSNVMLKAKPNHPASSSPPMPPPRPLPSQATKMPPSPDQAATAPTPRTETANQILTTVTPASVPPSSAPPGKKEDKMPEKK
jgi:hypothetical protein